MELELSLRSTIALLPLTALMLMIGGCDKQSEGSQQPSQSSVGSNNSEYAGGKQGLEGLDRSHAGKAAPTLPFVDANGAKRRVADYAGKPVLLNLWATWCAPCVKEMPTLDAVAVAKGDALHVLTVSQDLKGAEVVTPFFENAKFQKLQPLLDTEVAWSMQLGLNLPTTILFDSSGTEVWRYSGDLDWAGAEAAALIAEAK